MTSSEKTHQLEDERKRYDKLESEFMGLLEEVERLQAAHSSELAAEKKSHLRDSKSLRKAIDLKAMECVDLTRQVQEWQARYADESAKWMSHNEKLKDEFKPIQSHSSHLKDKLAEKERQVRQLDQEKMHIQGRLESKEDELKRYILSFRRAEEDWNRERQEISRLKVSKVDIEHELLNLQQENEGLKEANRINSNALTDVSNLRPVMEEAKRKISDLLSKEKKLSRDVLSLGKRERKAHRESDALQKRLVHLEMELKQTQKELDASTRELEKGQARVRDLEMQVTDWTTRHAQQVDIVKDLKEELTRSEKELSTNNQQVIGLTNLAQELKQQNQLLLRDIEDRNRSQNSSQEEKDQLLQEKAQLTAQISTQKQDLYDLQNRHRELALALDAERISKAELESKSSQNLNAVAKRINDLQSTMKETVSQISNLKSTETSLREDIAMRDETIRSQELELLKVTKIVAHLESQLTHQVREFDEITQKRKKEIFKLETAYEDSQSGLQDNVLRLNNLLTQKTQELTKIRESAAEDKLCLSEVKSEKATLESKMNALFNSEASLMRQIQHMESFQTTQKSENERLRSRIAQLESQSTLQDQEIKIFRQGAQHPPVNINQIQRQMDTLSKRVQEQVESLLDEDGLFLPRSHNASPQEMSIHLETFPDIPEISRRY